MSNEITTTQNQQGVIAPLKRFNSFITNPRSQEYLSSVLGEKKASFVNNLTALVSNNAMLQECEPATVMYAALKATALDLPLDPNLGFAYVLPYRNNKAGKVDAQFQLGYKSFIQLALRTGQFKTINVMDVREGEIVEEDFITGEYKFRRAQDREAKPVIGYCAYMKLMNGFEKYLYMTTEEVKAHALRFSQTFRKGYGLWADKEMFDKMAEKTVVKMLLSKWAPLSVEMQTAIRSDQAVIRGEDSYDYVDSQEDTADTAMTEKAKAKAQENVERARRAASRKAAPEAVAEKEEDLPEGDVIEMFPEEG